VIATVRGEANGKSWARRSRHQKSVSDLFRAGYNLTGIPAFSGDRDSMNVPCSHPKVRIVSRDQDAEYVECEDCREVFESGEFRDMEIESREDEIEEE